MEIYKCNNYKKYLNMTLSKESFGRGGRSKLANFLGCQSGFISHVLNGDVNFSLEQAIKINRFLGHDESASDFFILLVLLERSGSVELEKHFKAKIKQVLQKRANVRDRIKVGDKLTEKDHLTYYGHWYYSAVHIACSIPELQTRKALLDKFKISPSLLSKILDFLLKKRLVIQKGDKFLIGKARIHIDRNSPLFLKHHTNWRLRAISSLENENLQSLHYSGAISISKKDAEEIREILLHSIEKSESLLKNSSEEVLYSISVDFFEL